MQPTVTPDTSDLQQQTNAMAVISTLNDVAMIRRLTITPQWNFIGGNLVSGSLRSDDDTAIRELDTWRDIFGGTGRLTSYGYTSHFEGSTARKVWVVNVTVDDVSIQFLADVPATVATAPATVPMHLALLGPVGRAA
jgi:hypothetical protein